MSKHRPTGVWWATGWLKTREFDDAPQWPQVRITINKPEWCDDCRPGEEGYAPHDWDDDYHWGSDLPRQRFRELFGWSPLPGESKRFRIGSVKFVPEEEVEADGTP